VIGPAPPRDLRQPEPWCLKDGPAAWSNHRGTMAAWRVAETRRYVCL